MSHRVKGFGAGNEADVDVFLEDVDNLIPGSSAFSKSSLYIWKFSVQVLLKPCLENFELYLLVCEISAILQEFEHSLALPFFGIGMEIDHFQSCVHC